MTTAGAKEILALAHETVARLQLAALPGVLERVEAILERPSLELFEHDAASGYRFRPMLELLLRELGSIAASEWDEFTKLMQAREVFRLTGFDQ